MYSVLKMSLNDCIQGQVPKDKLRLASSLHQDQHSALAVPKTLPVSKLVNIFENSFFFSASKSQINENRINPY